MTTQDFQRARKPEERIIRRDALLAAAAELFDEGGPAGAGLNAIAARAGFTKSNVYRYFESREEVLLSALRKTFAHVSAERVLSGPGLVNLYNAVCATEGMAPKALSPADVTDAAIARTDAQCVVAVEYFTRFLGSVAGNLALTLGSLGGLYIGGGIVPRLGAAFDQALFRQQFEDKGRYQALLQSMPVWLITASTPALVGASRALDVLS